ncbi:MAG: CRP/FNR family cyclic AMP-dependent transcriptional regulator [Phenylobacterium sp.]|jgi:CRP/FNR family cyclic AMP-dependent transcriptional regulator
MSQPINKLKLLEILSRVSLFKSLTSGERSAVLDSGVKFQSIAPDNNFIVEGSQGPSFFIILSGEATVKQGGHNVAVLKSGQFIGEMGFICNEPRTATVVALTDMLVLKIDRNSFRQLPIKIREEIKDKVILGLVARVSRQNKQIIALKQDQLLDDDDKVVL